MDGKVKELRKRNFNKQFIASRTRKGNISVPKKRSLAQLHNGTNLTQFEQYIHLIRSYVFPAKNRAAY
jgi:hypothetical protein